MDVKSVNIPDLSFVPSKDVFSQKTQIFVFAGFLKPGRHQILIYDHILNRAFYKEFVVNLNSREDLYTEYPVVEGMIVRKGIKNVFEGWKN